jgi:serine/threonine protein kinase
MATVSSSGLIPPVRRRMRTRSSSLMSPSPLERYQLVAKIGQGSFGVVSEFLDAARGYVPVAIKEVTIRDEFEREVGILRDLGTNQYVISLLNFFENAGKFYIVMPKAELTLGRYLLRNRPDHDMVANIVMQIAYGLHGLHHLGWVHADLKPENMVVTRSGSSPRVQIIDFGSCFRSLSSSTASTSTATLRQTSDFPEEDAYVTTRWYRSPEVVTGIPNAVDKPIDIWALGCIAVEMLTGLVTFPAEDETELLGMFEAFFGPFDPEFIELSPYAETIFYDPAKPSKKRMTADAHTNSHLYGQWFERLGRALTIPVPWDDYTVTTSRHKKTHMYAGDVPLDLFAKKVDMNAYVNSVTVDARLIHTIQKMLAVDPGRRIDVDGVISSFF